jgi:FOG: HEAT repeat
MLNQEQEFDASPAIGGQRFPAITTRSLLRSLLVGFVGACVLTLLLSLAIFLPFHLFAHFILLIIIGLIEFLLFSIVAFFAHRPFTLYRYLRSVHLTQRKYHDLYTPLTALTNFRKTAGAELNDTAKSVKREEHLSILDLVSRQEAHQLILGVPGAGKTMALRVYQFLCSQRPLHLALVGSKVPVFVPMKNYSLYLRQQSLAVATPVEAPTDDDLMGTLAVQKPSLLTYLEQTNVSGMRYLRPYVGRLFTEGRLLVLCDGLNEIDSLYLPQVCEELVHLMRETNNRLVMTCREVDYREQGDLIQLVDEGQAARADMYPLDPAQVQEFVTRYIERQDGHWTHSAAEIMAVIDRSRLRYHCTNPMMLFTLMEIIDKIGVERGKQVDTRGRLLRESVRQMIANELARSPENAPDEYEVVRFLSEVACAARWAHDRNAIQLRVSSSTGEAGPVARGKRNFDELGDELKFWLDEHPAQSPFFDSDEDTLSAPYDDVGRILQFAQGADIIEISQDGVLSFRHELIAEYFVAEYFTAAVGVSLSGLTLRDDLLDDVGRWSEPVAIWAGLLDHPLDLAACFGRLGLQQQGYVLQALTLGLICVGVLWTPPQAEIQQQVVLPQTIEDALAIAVRNRQAREELAVMFQRCAEEGGEEVYRSLLPLITVDGVDELLSLLDQHIVPDLLFTQLQDAADDVAYEPQVKRIVRVLGRFGAPVVARATELSLPAPERSLRLRAAAVNTLGWTAHASAVEPLFERLRDSDIFIAQRATNALVRLGPQLTLARIFVELENRTPGPYLSRVHQALLAILGRFVDPPDDRYRLSAMQYQHVMEHVVPILTSNYEAEPEVQEVAGEFLVMQGRRKDEGEGGARRAEKTLDTLLSYLTSQDTMAVTNIVEVLQEIGTSAVPRVIDRLQHPSELMRVRAVEILSASHDYRALQPLLRTLSDPQDAVWQAVAQTLQLYAPESIPGLIEQVLTGPSDEVAERSSNVLVAIGEPVVTQVIDALAQVVAGRSRFLVQILERLGDVRAVPALIRLVDQPQLEPLLVVAIIRALCQFPDERVVAPLLKILALPATLVYEAAIIALSQLPELTFAGLVAALDVPKDTPFTQRVRRALLLMTPFPGEQLMRALEQRQSDAQAQQILLVFVAQGKDAAQILVQNLLHRDELMREYVHQALEQMPGPVVVPALLEAAQQPTLRKTIGTFLLKYPAAAIPALVGLLGERERGPFAVELLPQFGAAVLRPLVVALNDQRSQTRDGAQQVIVALVRQQSDEQLASLLLDVVRLFYPPLPILARQALMDVLTDRLSEVSIPALLSGLEDVQLLNDVADAFLRMAQKPALQEKVLDELVNALYNDERRQGAEIALIREGALVVPRIGDLIINENPAIATSARTILSEIGAPALSFIWTAQSDRSNLGRREAAMRVFSSMPPEVIKDELLELLVSDDRDNVAMAVSLLLAKIYEEGQQPYQDQVMVPELIDYVREHDILEVNLRIIALLLLLGEPAFVDHLVQALWERPQQRKQLLYLFLLLGPHTQRVLLENFEDPDSSPDLKAELATVLGMTTTSGVLVDYVRHISAFGLSPQRNEILQPDELTIALRALGSLLASGNWDLEKLQDLRSDGDDTLHEISNVLLGVRYEPQLAKLRHDLDSQRETFKKELITATAKMEEHQEYISKLELELEKISDTHSDSVDELQKITRERDMLKVQLARMNKEKNDLVVEKNEEIEKIKRDKDLALQNYHILQRQLSNVLSGDDGPREGPRPRSNPGRSRPSRY